MSGTMFRRGLLAASRWSLGWPAGAAAQQPRRQAAGLPDSRGGGRCARPTRSREDDDKAMAAMLGAPWRDFVPGRERRRQRATARAYLAAWDESHKVDRSSDGAKAMVEVGTTGWTLPIPIVKDGAEWRFDVEAGLNEMERAPRSAATSSASSRPCWRSSMPSATTPRSIR